MTSKLQVMNIQRMESEPIPELTGEITQMWPQRTVKGQKGESRVQSGTFKTSMGEILPITLWNRDEITAGSFFKPIEIKCVPGQRGGLLGVKVGRSQAYTDKKGNKHPERLVVEVGDKADVSWLMDGPKLETVPQAAQRIVKMSPMSVGNANPSSHERIAQMANLYEACLREVNRMAKRNHNDKDFLDTDSIRTVSTCLFIQATKENLVVENAPEIKEEADDLVF